MSSDSQEFEIITPGNRDHIGLDDPPVIDELLDQWGEVAQTILDTVTEGPHYRKKRRTLLRLAEAAYLNTSQATVFQRPTCASKVAHYKWRKVDPSYEEAYLYLIGDPAQPGVARLTREQELDEDEALAISALVEARTRLRLASADAVRALTSALQASDPKGYALWRERIVAANSILDRADTDTAARTAPAVAIVDAAILQVYADAHPDDQQAGLPSPPPAALISGSAHDDEGHDSHEHGIHDDEQPGNPADQPAHAADDATLAHDEPTQR